MRDDIGQQLGNYQLIQLLGQGHWASVYLGDHRHLHTQAAIKVLHGPWADSEVDGFLSEARTLAHLRHPHIVRVLDFGVQEGTPFLVLEYAPGGTLRQLHPKGAQLPLQTVVSYIKQVASALQYAHEQRLIHRDLKPENLLLGPDQQVWLSDFGLAIVVHSTRSQSFQQTAGTLAYMAPEQLEGHSTPASDQYALGVLVYEWLTGERPFSGSFPELLVKQTQASPPPLSERVPTMPAGVDQIVLQALAKDPAQRFASVQAFALALEEGSREDASGQTLPLLASGDSAEAGRRAASMPHLISGLPADFPPLKTLDTHPNNLPVQLTALIGREQEVATIQKLLRREDVRLVTLTGPGGIGKTRLGLEVAAALSDDFADGVFFVNLAPLSDPELVMPIIAQTLGIWEMAGQSWLERLEEMLWQRQMLLLLDNFEPVVSAANVLPALLTACPQLKVLVTSREVLHVRAEHAFPVPPLTVPDLQSLPNLAAFTQYEAVTLFIERTQAVKPDFHLTATNARALAEICIRLDGLPLAIELAAARIKLFPLQALLRRLEHRLQVLTSGARDLPTRQRTLRDTIAWSYNLLDEQEQRLFRRLSVFVGGCTLEAIEAICRTLDASNGVGQILDRVASLIDKSLLQQAEQEGEEPRLVMLEMIREYGWEALATSGEAEITQRAHAAYYLALAEEAEPHLTSPRQGSWLERLQREHENLRAALVWLVEHKEQEAALRLGAALWRFWWVCGLLSEGRTELSRALSASEGVATPVQAKALNAAGALAAAQGDFEQAETLCGESQALFRARGDPRGMATSLWVLGYTAWQQSDYAAAGSRLEEALALSKEVDDRDGIISLLFNLALVFLSQGEYDQARALAEEAVVFSREGGGTTWSIAGSLWILALVMSFQGDLTRVHALLEESLALSRQEGYKEGIGYSLYISGLVALQQGDIATARTLLEESLALFKALGDRQNIAQSLIGLGWISLVQDDYAEARALLEESLALASAVGNKWFIATCLVGFGGLATAQREWTWAARLSGAVEALCKAINGVLPPAARAMHEFTVAAARAQLGEETFRAAWAEGRMMSLEQVLAAQGPMTMPTTASAGLSSVPHARKAPTYPDELTAREVEVLRLVAQGLTNEQVAEQLVISHRTVNTHLTSIFSKIRVSSRGAATRYAIEHNLA